MGLTVRQRQQHLAHFEFEAIFLQDLGWEAVPPMEAHVPQVQGMILARQGLAAVVLVADWPLATLSRPELQYALATLAQARIPPLVIDPLVIAIAADGQRSLWCWRSGKNADAPWRTRVVIQGQADRSWATQLRRLHRDDWHPDQRLGEVLNTADFPLTPERVQGFQRSWHSLSEALTALPQAAERRHYGLVLLLRLMAVAALQQRGYLGGDEWYLHNQFGQSQQRGSDRFFTDILQPLCQTGFVLPPEECPVALRERLGTLPFVPTGPFTPMALDHRWGQGVVADAAFEPALEWLGDLLLAPALDLGDLLPEILEQAINHRSGGGLVTPEPMLWALGDRTLNAKVLDCARDLTGQAYTSLDQLLLTLTPPQAGELLGEIGQLTLLDPACGSGRYLRWALHQLLYITHSLAAIAALHPTTSLPDWAQLPPGGTAELQGLRLYRHLATHGLWGLDLWPAAVAMARLQIFLVGVQQTSSPPELASLPDLTLTLVSGNALMGLITVDAERLDQTSLKGRRAASYPTLDEDSFPRQGNLLQPLMANTYQAVLTERQVSLEHYRSQTELLGESGSVPTYAQADFLRERLEEINQTTQAKLTHLLWSEASQQLSIKIPGQTEAGRRQSRPLTLADVEAMHPFHWGFYLHGLLRDRGGFDLILSHFPAGVVQPTEAGFLAAYEDLFQVKGVAPSTFLNNHKQVLTIDPDLTQAWAHYRSQFALPSQYFRRSGHYPYSGQPAPGQTQARLYWSRLFLERSLQLLRPGGRCAVMLDPFWAMGNSAPLRHWLEAETELGSVVDMSNHGGLWPDLPPRTTVSLLWLKKQGHTQTSPYSAYTRAPKPVTAHTLGAQLQRLLYLAE